MHSSEYRQAYTGFCVNSSFLEETWIHIQYNLTITREYDTYHNFHEQLQYKPELDKTLH